MFTLARLAELYQDSLQCEDEMLNRGKVFWDSETARALIQSAEIEIALNAVLDGQGPLVARVTALKNARDEACAKYDKLRADRATVTAERDAVRKSCSYNAECHVAALKENDVLRLKLTLLLRAIDFYRDAVATEDKFSGTRGTTEARVQAAQLLDTAIDEAQTEVIKA